MPAVDPARNRKYLGVSTPVLSSVGTPEVAGALDVEGRAGEIGAEVDAPHVVNVIQAAAPNRGFFPLRDLDRRKLRLHLFRERRWTIRRAGPRRSPPGCAACWRSPSEPGGRRRHRFQPPAGSDATHDLLPGPGLGTGPRKLRVREFLKRDGTLHQLVVHRELHLHLEPGAAETAGPKPGFDPVEHFHDKPAV